MPIQQLSYSGGINSFASLGTMPPNQLVTCTNLRLLGNSLSNTGGAFNLLQSSTVSISDIQSIFYWIQANGDEWFIFEAYDGTNNNIYQMANDNSTKSPTKIISSVNPNARFDSLNGVLVIAPSTVPYKWTGAGAGAALGASWTALNVAMWDCHTVNNFMFFAASDFSSNIYWSNGAIQRPIRPVIFFRFVLVTETFVMRSLISEIISLFSNVDRLEFCLLKRLF